MQLKPNILDRDIIDRDLSSPMEDGYGEDGEELVEASPLDRVRDAVSGAGPDLSQSGSMMPDNPGPSVAGREPVIGSARRQRGLPVVRDQIPSLMD